MAFSVVYDACVLYPAPLRDLLVRIAAAGIVRAYWTEAILDECFENISKQRPDLSRERLARTREMMNNAARGCIVTGYETLIEGLSLPDVDDRHVLAAALRSGAQVIVTFNLRDFPATSLEPFGIEAKHPDIFILETLDISPVPVCAVVEQQLADLKNPPRTRDDLLRTLTEQGLPQSVARLRELLAKSPPLG